MRRFVLTVALIALLGDGCAHKEPALPYVGLDGGPIRPTPTLEPYVKNGAPVEGLYVIEGTPPELLVNSRTQNNRLRLTLWRLSDPDLPNGEVFFRSLVFCDTGVPQPESLKSDVGNTISA